jgi:lysophospholipase L1-like esterase
MGGLVSRVRSLSPRAAGLFIFALAAALVVVVTLVALLTGGQMAATAGRSPTASSTAGGSTPASSTPTSAPPTTPLPTDSPTPALPPPEPTTRPTPTPIDPQLPTLLGAIGDSYSQAWGVSPLYPRDHPQFSWVVGTAKKDGVFSLLERFQALGGSPRVVDAATSGRKMNDASRQATAIVAAAGKLTAGQTAYVTFELGTNDLCSDPKTDPATFEAQLRSAVAILRAGLPAGSRILMIYIPDFAHLRDVTQSDPKARAALALPQNSMGCPPFLGAASPATLDQAEAYLQRYDSILVQVCDEIAATDGATGKLDCTSDPSLLSLGDFTVADMSTVDYFHPSLSGQGRLAADAWTAGAWGSIRLPPGAAALVPTGGGIEAGWAANGFEAILLVSLPVATGRKRLPRPAVS